MPLINFILKTSFIFLLSQGLFTVGYSQNRSGMTSIQKHSRRAPLFTRKKLDKLALYLCKDLQTEEEKVEAISYWIAKNIKYNISGAQTRHEGGLTTEQVLKKRHAICGEYALLFQELCATQGIAVNVVEGYTIPFDFFAGDTLYRADHAWNSVRVNGQWRLYDLTWAAGYVDKKKQTIPKCLFKYFNIPYKIKEKFYFKYQPKWVNTSPITMIFTHKPLLDGHQLLQKPINQEVFQQMAQGIYRQLIQDTALDLTSFASNHYFNLPDTQKFEMNAVKGFENNPQNHRIMGYGKYRVLFNQYKEYYASETGLVQTSDSKLYQMQQTARVSDSLLLLSMEDNKKEYRFKDKRSLGWKNTLNFTNKRLLTQNKEAQKILKAERKIIDRTAQKQKLFKAYAKNIERSWLKKDSYKLKGPTKNAKVDSTLHSSFHEQIKKHHLNASIALHLKDSLLGVYDEWDIDHVKTIEKESKEHNKYASEMTVYYYKTKVAEYPMIYRDSKSLYKVDISNELDSAFHKNISNTYVVSHALYQNQNRAKTEMVKYLKYMKLALQAIKLARKQTRVDTEEQELFDSYTQEIISEYQRLIVQLNGMRILNKTLIQILKSQNKILGYTNKYLKKEISFEKMRHNHYRRHYKFVKKDEDTLAKSMIKQVRYFNRVTQKTIKKRAQ